MTYPPNIAYVTYGPLSTTEALNPYWQQLSQWGSSYSVTGDTLSVSLSGGSGNEWGGVISEQTLFWLKGSSLAVEIDPGDAANSGDAMWAGIQLTSAFLRFDLDPTATSAAYPLVRLAVDQGNLWFGEVTGSGTNVWCSVTYDPVNHRHVRMSTAGGNFGAQSSPDGVTWTPIGGTGASPSSLGPYYPELIVYSTGSIASTASFSDLVFFAGDPLASTAVAAGTQIPMSVVGSTSPSLSIPVSAVIVSSANEIVAVTGDGLPAVTVPFSYGDSAELINAYAMDAVRAAAGDFSLQVVFVG